MKHTTNEAKKIEIIRYSVKCHVPRNCPNFHILAAVLRFLRFLHYWSVTILPFRRETARLGWSVGLFRLYTVSYLTYVGHMIGPN